MQDKEAGKSKQGFSGVVRFGASSGFARAFSQVYAGFGVHLPQSFKVRYIRVPEPNQK
jgi:hypothetical protein